DYGMVAVRDDAPWKTLGELMTAMKNDPTKVVVGAGASIGSQDWMKTALLASKAGIDPRKMRYVAFEGGGEPVTALLGNHIQVVSGDMSEMVPHLQAGKLRVLAVMSDKRLPGKLASVPTAKEQGFDVEWPIIRGFYLGPKVSEADYQWWEETFKKLVNTPEFQKQRDMRGLFEFNLFGKELDSYVKTQVADYREKAKSFGLAK
ncbi:MAG: tripartite tricarboxylate transporter substrate-binding protein, partial [Mixta calida]|nr:tripartite tricarboxylate transporter substrate-binding protein [Mixta calida]